MLASLFGDLGVARARPQEDEWQDTQDPNAVDFAASAVLESTDTSVNERGQMVDRHVKDLFITGSPARAIRAHFATHGDPESASHAITLYDPVGLWAPATIKALSDASGQPIERLHLRDQNSLRTLAMIERTRVVRRFDDTLKIYHVDERSTERGHTGIPVVMMERAQLTAVIVGPMHAESVAQMIEMLHAAAQAPSWRCPHLMFMLPPAAVWIAGKIAETQWPAGLHISVLNESLTGTSAVWNALLDAWNRTKSLTQRGDEAASAEAFGETGYPIRVADLDAGTTTVATEAPAEPLRTAPRHGLDGAIAKAMLSSLAQQEGVIACAVVDGANGGVVASEVRDANPAVDIEQAAAASAQVLRAQRMISDDMGLTEPVDEMVLSAGGRQQVLRQLSHYPGLLVYALLDSRQGNLALLRYRLMEADRALA